MQIVIEIHDMPVNDLESWILAHGTPLPEHGDLIDRTKLLKQYGLENATKYGNKDAEQQKHSYSTMMMYEIADMIKDAETIISATKEKQSRNLTVLAVGDGRLQVREFFKQTATKEGDGE